MPTQAAGDRAHKNRPYDCAAQMRMTKLAESTCATSLLCAGATDAASKRRRGAHMLAQKGGVAQGLRAARAVRRACTYRGLHARSPGQHLHQLQADDVLLSVKCDDFCAGGSIAYGPYGMGHTVWPMSCA